MNRDLTAHRSNRLGLARLALLPLLTLALGGTATMTARADDDHDRQEQGDRGGHDRGWHDQGWQGRDHERGWHQQDYWRQRGRVYYGERVYVDPPPLVVYGPPPPPSGLNLLFSFGR